LRGKENKDFPFASLVKSWHVDARVKT